ncbi:MAG: hypothetical protein U0795_24970 [Pirellulales bacterium]
MMRFAGYVFGVLLIGSALGLNPLIGQTAAPEEKSADSIVASLFRRDHPQSTYASYLLEVRSDTELGIRAFLDLRQDSKKLASIPLLPVSQKDADGGSSIHLRVNCVALDEISDKSFFYVFVTDPQTGTTIKEIRVLLDSAQPVAQLPGE